jgi:hypothetical protein
MMDTASLRCDFIGLNIRPRQELLAASGKRWERMNGGASHGKQKRPLYVEKIAALAPLPRFFDIMCRVTLDLASAFVKEVSSVHIVEKYDLQKSRRPGFVGESEV